ncbi:MAG: thioredoxin [Nanoarchaeota archaeon]
MATVKITLTNFDKEILNAKKPAILDFWATWCGPCQWMSPVFDELSDEYGKKMIFGKVNVDEETLLSQKFGIRGIPCMILFKNGEEADRIVGFVPKEELEAKLKGFLA